MSLATKLKSLGIALALTAGVASEAAAACQQMQGYVECVVCSQNVCCTTRFITCCEYFYNSCEPE